MIFRAWKVQYSRPGASAIFAVVIEHAWKSLMAWQVYAVLPATHKITVLIVSCVKTVYMVHL